MGWTGQHWTKGRSVKDFLMTDEFRPFKSADGSVTRPVFRVKGDKPDEWRTISTKFSPAVEQVIKSRYGDNLIEILNKRKGVQS